MVPSQTLEILVGAIVALLYAGTVLSIGALPLAAFLGREACTTARARVGVGGFAWLGFVVGQGILGIVWLIVSLAGILHAWLIWIVCALAWFIGSLMLLAYRRQVTEWVSGACSRLLAGLSGRSWYVWIGASMVVVGLLCATMALLPPWATDVHNWYFVVAKMIAFSHKLEFQPFATPHNGLYPLQVEMHWAALFAISNETAVTVWDYLCALSALWGLGLLSWALTRSRRVVLLALLMLLSTPAFYDLMGGGKVDNAAAQYGLAAFLWLVLWPILRVRSIILAGLCLGWGMAARYTYVVFVPALIVFAVIVIHDVWKVFPVDTRSLKRLWVTNALVAGIATAVAGAPMLFKNWLLVGCPLAPHFGCQETFWAGELGTLPPNISVLDLFFYPFVWTFGDRADMAGNISPLFIGFFPFLLVYRRFPIVQCTRIAGLAGLVALATWLLIKPLHLHPRWLLVPVGLLAVPLSASIVAAEEDLRRAQTAGWLIRSTIFSVLFFLLFQSRGVAHAVRYLASIDSRATRYELLPYFGYDVANWLNTHVQAGERVALTNWTGSRYLLSPNILLHSESVEERQWRWEHRGKVSLSDLWNFFAQHGFTYWLVPKADLHRAASVWPNSMGPEVAFMGRNDAVLKIEGQQLVRKAAHYIERLP